MSQFVKIKELTRGKHRFLVSADCPFGKFFNGTSFKILHNWMTENIGTDYASRLDGWVFTEGHQRSTDYIYYKFDTREQAIGFSIAVGEAAVDTMMGWGDT